jgi:hypothetical protein
MLKLKLDIQGTLIRAGLLTCLCGLSTWSAGQADASAPNAVGPPSVIVHSKFGGQIFGFDTDQNGTEGVLSESQPLTNGNYLAAVETFDQATGKILNVMAKTQTQDDSLLLNTLNGFGFSNAFNVVPAHIALKPSNRPSSNVNSLQRFSY